MALAMDRNRLIGRDNGMPWRIPGEQAHFKEITLGKPIIMGRATFDSIGRPLPGRLNVVVTRSPEWHADGVVIAHDLDSALDSATAQARADGASEVVVIGGAALCHEVMERTHRFYLTRVDQAFDGDTWLECFNETDWQEVSRESPNPAITGGIPIHYCVLERRA